MIVFDQNNSESYKEGVVSDTFKTLGSAATGINADRVKDEWMNSSNAYDYGKTVNDTILSPVQDRMGGINDALSKHQVDTRSIIARARNSTMHFPVYISQSASVRSAHIISEMFARVYATKVQTVMSQNPIMSEEEADDLVFLKQYHTNISEAADIDFLINEYYEPVDDIDQMLKDAAFCRIQISPNTIMECCVVPSTNKILLKENARLMNEPLSGFSYLQENITSETSSEITDDSSATTTNNPISDNDFKSMAINELNMPNSESKYAYMKDSDIMANVASEMRDTRPVKPADDATDDEKDEYNRLKADWDNEYRQRCRDKIAIRDDVEAKIDEIKDSIKRGIYGEEYVYKNGVFYHISQTFTDKNLKKTVIRPTDPNNLAKPMDTPVILRETDIKKENGMLPYTIQITFRIKSENGSYDRVVRYLLNVKSVLHLIRVQDLADDLHELVTGNVKALQKVRYKTGEISFNDYFFNMKGVKKDAAKSIDYNKRWINTLKKNAEWSKLHGSVFKNLGKFIHGNNEIPIPNGTLVLTQADVTMLVNQTGIDLSDVYNVGKLADSLFLIAVVILDASAGSMRVIFPADNLDWEVYSLANVESEIAKTDNSVLMSELNKIVNKGGK